MAPVHRTGAHEREAVFFLITLEQTDKGRCLAL